MNYIKSSIDYDSNVVTTKWLRTVNSLEYRESVSHFYELIRNTEANNWIIDASRIISPDLNDQQWTVKYLGIRLGSTFLKKIAVVLPDDLFLEVVSEKMIEAIYHLAGNRVTIALFRSIEQAMNWIEPVNDTEGLFRKDPREAKENGRKI